MGKSYQSNVFARSLVKQYPVAEHSEGIYIYDTDGNKYIDGCCGALVSNLGHGNTEIIEQVSKQIKELAFAHTSQFTSKPLEEYAALIAEFAPGDLNYTYFVSGGSEANETAIKMARQYFLEINKPSKHKVIARWTSYHGNTLGTLSAGGHVARRLRHIPQLLDISHIDSPDWYRNPDADPIQYAQLLEQEILRLGPDQVSAFILEPITGSSNAGSYSPITYYKKVREICDKYDVLLIVDEVMSGFGRTGKNFAIEHFDVIPDIITTGKGISGGYSPLSAVIVRQHILEAFFNGSGQFSHGHTYCGNPVSISAGLAVLKYINNQQMVDQVAKKGEILKKELERISSESSIIGRTQGLGLMHGLEFVVNKETKEPFPREDKLVEKITEECFKLGLIVYPGSGNVNGIKGDTVLIAPPFIISEEEIYLLTNKFEQAIKKVESTIDKMVSAK